MTALIGTGRRARVVRHRARRLSPVHRGIAYLLFAVIAIAAALAAGIGVLVHQRVQEQHVVTSWTVPIKLEVVAEPTGGGPPTRLRIPSVKIDTRLDPLGLAADGTLATPTEFERAGWFADGTAPGDVGPAVIAGHVDNRTAGAVFYRLAELKRGAKVEVERDGHWLTFTVTAREEYPKATFPTARVYGPTPGPELRLITCGGEFDKSRGSYRDNIVVYAVLTS